MEEAEKYEPKFVEPAYYTITYCKRGKRAAVVAKDVSIDAIFAQCKADRWDRALVEAWLSPAPGTTLHLRGYTIKVTPNKPSRSTPSEGPDR